MGDRRKSDAPKRVAGMNQQEAQESVAHLTVRQLIRTCPKGAPMKEALDRQSRRKRKQPAAVDGADYDEEEEAVARAMIANPRSLQRGHGGAPGARGAMSGAGAGDGAAFRANARDDPDEANGDGAVFAPQVRIIDGRIVIDEESLEVTAGRLDTRLEEPSLVIEGNSSVTYGTYMNKTPSEKWLPDETETFFRALAQYGTDFSLIERILPHRSRRQIKLKFKREERENPARVNDALTRRLPANTEELRRIVEQVQSARAARPSATAPQAIEAAAAAAHPESHTAPEVPTTARLPSGLLGSLEAPAARRGPSPPAPLQERAAPLAPAEGEPERVIVEEDDTTLEPNIQPEVHDEEEDDFDDDDGLAPTQRGPLMGHAHDDYVDADDDVDY